VSVVTALAALVAGCSSGGSDGSGGGAGSGKGGSTASASPTVKTPTVALAKGARQASYSKAVHIAVADGSFTSVQVSTKTGNHELEGEVSGDGTEWVSQATPRPSSAYRVVAQVKDAAGQVRSVTTSFRAQAVPDDKRIAFSVTPDDGTTVGIGQPIQVRFLSSVTERAAVQKVMTVHATTASGRSVAGSWSWLNAQQVDWRPDTFWQPGTSVSLSMKIAGVKAASGRYGRKDYSEKFTIGASHITRVDASAHTVKVYRDGKLVNTWPTSTGRTGLETYSGTYVVLGKAPVVQMDSCSARVTCDKKNPDYYDEKEYFATRITASGTFLHAADWDKQLGEVNDSHGCIHLSGVNAKTFYQHAVVGDVVVVTHSGRGPQERIDTQDPGLYDWNVSRAVWKRNSAL
jgi:lipoprotein-anchoring transpeptidase ErfK/SrfK